MKKGWKITLLFSGTAVLSGIVFYICKTMYSILPADVFLAAIVLCISTGVMSGVIQIIEFGKDKTDQGEAYAHCILEAGVLVQLSRYSGMLHDFVVLPRIFDQVKDAIDEISTALRKTFSMVCN